MTTHDITFPAEPLVRMHCSRVRTRARRRLAWLSRLSEQDPVRAVVDDMDSPEAERAWYHGTAEVEPWNVEVARLDAAMRNATGSRFGQLVEILKLDPAEADLLGLALAIALDPGIRRLIAVLTGSPHRGTATTEVAARLFQHGRDLVLTGESAIRAWGILSTTTNTREEPGWELGPALCRWLQGVDGLEDVLVGHAHLLPADVGAAWWPVEETARGFKRALAAGAGALTVEVHGAPGSGRRSFSAAVAHALGLGLLVVDPPADDTGRLVALHAHRHALLNRTAIAWTRPPPVCAVLQPCPFQFFLSAPGEPTQLPGMGVSWRVVLSAPPIGERATLWRQALPAIHASDPEGIAGLARRYRATPGEVSRVARSGPPDAGGAALQLREVMRGNIGDLAQRLDCPFDWDDLVVPSTVEQQLHDLTYEASVRGEVWENPDVARLFPQGRGLLALFCGPPGTGKTMSAQVLANMLGLDLFRVDLAGLVSKYVGETSKNVEKVLSAAARLDAILLFDEADALFGRRTEIKDAHDRFANTDTNYLLQAIESWSGFAILATNKRANMDSAFTRRLRHIVEFPAPDGRDRLRLWQGILGALGGVGTAERLSGLSGRLASSIEMSGAQIKFAVLHAIITARRTGEPPGAAHLLAGVDRELWKEGRGISRTERERLAAHA